MYNILKKKNLWYLENREEAASTKRGVASFGNAKSPAIVRVINVSQ